MVEILSRANGKFSELPLALREKRWNSIMAQTIPIFREKPQCMSSRNYCERFLSSSTMNSIMNNLCFQCGAMNNFMGNPNNSPSVDFHQAWGPRRLNFTDIMTWTKLAFNKVCCSIWRVLIFFLSFFFDS